MKPCNHEANVLLHPHRNHCIRAALQRTSADQACAIPICALCGQTVLEAILFSLSLCILSSFSDLFLSFFVSFSCFSCLFLAFLGFELRAPLLSWILYKEFWLYCKAVCTSKTKIQFFFWFFLPPKSGPFLEVLIILALEVDSEVTQSLELPSSEKLPQ